jgi:flagellar assembly protein FliH
MLPPSPEPEDEPFDGDIHFEKAAAAEPDWNAMRESVLAEARQEAEALRLEANGFLEQALRDIAQQDQIARAEREKLTADAWEQAKVKGHAEGMESARRATLDTIDRANKEAARLAASIEAEGEALRRDTPSLLLRLSLDIAEKILRSTLAEDNEAFLSLAAAAVDEAGLVRKVELRLNPEDYLRVFGDAAGGETARVDMDTSRGSVAATLSPDPSIQPLNVRAEYPGGSIDTGVDVGMEKLREALYGD